MKHYTANSTGICSNRFGLKPLEFHEIQESLIQLVKSLLLFLVHRIFPSGYKHPGLSTCIGVYYKVFSRREAASSNKNKAN